MQQINLLARSVLGFLRQLWLLPRSLAGALKNRRQHALQAANEAERLDRIRNPSDYLGK